ncbi:MAG: hypothetical protein HC942_29330 [Microcoleus sp. SU_5_6]|nr:hypothetical protein [Microcoleus sp. SU_5_6]
MQRWLLKRLTPPGNRCSRAIPYGIATLHATHRSIGTAGNDSDSCCLGDRC